MAAWLAEHPQVFMSPVKEPHFFNFDYGAREFRSLRRYESLFDRATKQHRAVGEASTRYLYSRTAVPAIAKYAKNPRFIVMIRNPVDMVYSLHDETVFTGDEDVVEFESAWKLQTVRMYGDRVPRHCTDPQVLMYGPLCRLGSQIQLLLNTVTRKQLLIIKLEDIQEDARREYLRTLEFLELDDDGRTHFPAVNRAKRRRLPKIWHTARWVNNILRDVGFPHIGMGFMAFLNSRGRQERPRTPMSLAIRSQLNDYFLDDICLLEQLTGLDLARWK